MLTRVRLLADGPFFEKRRHAIRNVTEVGVLFGGSAHALVDYFTKADVWALDTNLELAQKKYPPSKDSLRLHLVTCCLDAPQFRRANLVNESMDLVLEDAGNHHVALQTMLFDMMWPLVKKGGFYIIEDVDPQRGGEAYTQHHRALSPLRSHGRRLELPRARVLGLGIHRGLLVEGSE